tara:strand:+ start:34 stop:321 length:288 start_codon:yes stop_codon:yes gene_type:complete
MAITKTIVDDKIEIVTEFKHLQIRQATIIKEDGTELSRSFHRRMVQCGYIDESDNFVMTDISSETDEIKVLAGVVWTQSVKDAWKAKLIADKQLS